MSSDRRRIDQPRIRVRVPAVTEPVGTAGGRRFGETEDLSAAGMRLHQEEPTAPGVVVRVSLRLQQYLVLGLLGTVVWAEPHPDSTGWDLGIRFAEELTERAVVEIVSPDVSSPNAGSTRVE